MRESVIFSINAIGLLAIVSQAHKKQLVEDHMANVPDKLVAKLSSRLFEVARQAPRAGAFITKEAPLPRHSILDDTTLGKPGHVAMPNFGSMRGHLAISNSGISRGHIAIPAARNTPLAPTALSTLHSRSHVGSSAFNVQVVSQRTGMCNRHSTRCSAGEVVDLSEVPPAPGPLSVPGLGSLWVVWKLLVRKVPLPDILRELRAYYGSLFLIKTGPVKQVWVGDPDMLRKVYERIECCGRPTSFEDPFGEFLFLTREPEKAAVIKPKQKAWLDTNIKEAAVRSAVDAALSRLWPVLDVAGPQPWPEKAIKTTLYAAVTSALLGEAGLMSDEELVGFMAATKDYSEMRTKSKFGKKKDDKPEPPPGAERIKEIVLGALARAGRTDGDVALPLMVAASVGGAEIFPTFLHWIFLFFMREPARQEVAAQAAIKGDSAALMKELYAVLRRTTYSVALGPPRKILSDVEVDGMLLPEGALLFAMHPAIVDDALGREPPADDDFSSYAFGTGPRGCLGQQLTEALLPAVVGAILRKYKVEPADSASARVKPQGEQRGQLIYPLDPPLLIWKPRNAA